MSQATAGTLRFVAVADATARAAYPSSNYASQSTLNVDRSPDEEVFLRFQVSGASAGVSKAVLRLYTTNGSAAGPALYATGATWSEASLTWNSRPARTSASLGTRNPSTSTYVEYDVTSIVRGDGAFGFALVPTSTDGADFSSRESSDASRRPELVVTLVGDPEPPPPGGSEVTFVASADAAVQQAYPSTNYGRSTTLLSDQSPAESSFLRFTVSGVTGTITRAQVKLYVTNGSSNGPALYSANNSWVETAVTWNNRPARISAALGDLGAISTGQWITYDVTSVVRGNGDFSFELGATSTDGTDAASREASDASRRPVLVLTVDGGTPPPPPPSTKTVTLGATADTSVLEAYPSSSYGNASTLQSDGSPRERAYLRFEVPLQEGRILRARLRLYVTNGSSDGPQLFRADGAFTEQSTWLTQPGTLWPAIADAGAVSTGSWLEFNVSGAISQAGTYDFVLEGVSTDGLDVASSEYGDATRRPQLVLTVDTSTYYVERGSAYPLPEGDNGPIAQDPVSGDLFLATVFYKDFGLMRLTEGGLVQWSRRFTVSDPLSIDDDSYARIAQVVAAPDGTFWALLRIRMGQAEVDGTVLKGGDHLIHFSGAGAALRFFAIPQSGGSGYPSAYLGSVAFARDGDVVLTGAYSGTADFGGTTRSTSDSYATDGFIARYSPDFALRWVRTFSADDTAFGRDVAVAPSGDVLVGAAVSGTTASYENTSVPSGGGLAIRLSAAGATQWIKAFPDAPSHVALSPLGTAVVGGTTGLVVLEVNGAERFRRDISLWGEALKELAIDDAGSIRILAQGANVDFGAGLDGTPSERLYLGRINLDGEHRWTFSGPAAAIHQDFSPGPVMFLRPDGVAFVAGTFFRETHYDRWSFYSGGDRNGVFLLRIAP